jgi:hypothetical protein
MDDTRRSGAPRAPARPLAIRRWLARGLECALLWPMLSGCQHETPTASRLDLELRIPLPKASLDRASAPNGGLLQGIGADGWPVLDGAGVDPLVLEARQYYNRLGAPLARAEVRGTDESSAHAVAASPPPTIRDWKEAFGFPARGADELLSDYRARANVAVYYNKNELGLGRELGCTEFVDGTDAMGRKLSGVACYVTNYGALFGEQELSLRAAVAGEIPKNTVCIAYRPSFDAGFQVQFYVYGHDGNRQDWAQLDTLGPRPHPLVCTNCHGGSYDRDAHLVKDARFLPLDPNLVRFSEDPKTGLDRATQEERIRYANALAAKTPLSPEQQAAFAGLYGDKLDSPGRTAVADWVPPGWRDSQNDRQLYSRVVRPYCTTCHNAVQASVSAAFAAAAAFKAYPMPAYLCHAFSMPNAQATMHAFWGDAGAPLTVGAHTYASASDALLVQFGLDRASCAGFSGMTDCALSADPDRLCGDVHSGSACDRVTGQCVPAMTGDPAPSAAPVGVCRMDGSRGCPYTLGCHPAEGMIAGVDGYDGVCVPCGQSGQLACDGI